MGIRRDLWLKDDGSHNLAIFSLVTDKKKKVDTKKLFLTTLKNIKVPDGYSSNISTCIDLVQEKIGLKTHECHIILEQFLPLAIRNALPDHVVIILVKFFSFFKAFSSKTLNLSELDGSFICSSSRGSKTWRSSALAKHVSRREEIGSF
ncbi:hypothetical protein P3S68_020720 [Capsicum galapagoense]